MAEYVYDKDGMDTLDIEISAMYNDVKTEFAAATKKMEALNKSRSSIEDSLRTAQSKPIITVNTTGMTAEQAKAAQESAAAQNATRAKEIADLTAKLNEIKKQIEDLQKILDGLDADVKAIETVLKAVHEIMETMQAVETDVVRFTLKQLGDLQMLSSASMDIATNILDAIHENSEACVGAKYVEYQHNGETLRVYTDLYKDIDGDKYKKYVALAKTIGIEATMAIMDANDESLDFAYGVVSAANNGVVDTEKIKGIFSADKYKTNNVNVADMLSDKYDDVVKLSTAGSVNGTYFDEYDEYGYVAPHKYDVPQEHDDFLRAICEDAGIPYTIAAAIIAIESNSDSACITKASNGEEYGGYMQIADSDWSSAGGADSALGYFGGRGSSIGYYVNGEFDTSEWYQKAQLLNGGVYSTTDPYTNLTACIAELNKHAYDAQSNGYVGTDMWNYVLNEYNGNGGGTSNTKYSSTVLHWSEIAAQQ